MATARETAFKLQHTTNSNKNIYSLTTDVFKAIKSRSHHVLHCMSLQFLFFQQTLTFFFSQSLHRSAPYVILSGDAPGVGLASVTLSSRSRDTKHSSQLNCMCPGSPKRSLTFIYQLQRLICPDWAQRSLPGHRPLSRDSCSILANYCGVSPPPPEPDTCQQR